MLNGTFPFSMGDIRLHTISKSLNPWHVSLNFSRAYCTVGFYKVTSSAEIFSSGRNRWCGVDRMGYDADVKMMAVINKLEIFNHIMLSEQKEAKCCAIEYRLNV